MCCWACCGFVLAVCGHLIAALVELCAGCVCAVLEAVRPVNSARPGGPVGCSFAACLSVALTLCSNKVKATGDGALPHLVAIVTDAGSASKEQGNFIIKDAVSTSMSLWGSPFRCAAKSAQCLSRRPAAYACMHLTCSLGVLVAVYIMALPIGSCWCGQAFECLCCLCVVFCRPVQDTTYLGLLEASGPQLAAWMRSSSFTAMMASLFPPMPDAAALQRSHMVKQLELAAQKDCHLAFEAVRRFEASHNLQLQNMGMSFLQQRGALVGSILQKGGQLRLPDEVVHDAVLLLDRAGSTGVQVGPGHTAGAGSRGREQGQEPWWWAMPAGAAGIVRLLVFVLLCHCRPAVCARVSVPSWPHRVVPPVSVSAVRRCRKTSCLLSQPPCCSLQRSRAAAALTMQPSWRGQQAPSQTPLVWRPSLCWTWPGSCARCCRMTLWPSAPCAASRCTWSAWAAGECILRQEAGH